MTDAKDWFFDIENWLDEAKKLFWRINEIKNYEIRRDLMGMYHNVDNLSLEIMREQARIKTFKFQSQLHRHLVDKFNEYHQNLIEQLTYGLLSS